MKFLLVAIAVVVSITITAQDVQASTEGLQWSFGDYGTSDRLKMAPCLVVRSEHGYIAYPKIQWYQVTNGFTVTSDADGVSVNNYHKTMGEGETQTEIPFRWWVEATHAEPQGSSTPTLDVYNWNTEVISA